MWLASAISKWISLVRGTARPAKPVETTPFEFKLPDHLVSGLQTSSSNCSRENAGRAADDGGQELELANGVFQPLAGAPYLGTSEIHFDIAEASHIRATSPADRRSRARTWSAIPKS